MLIAYSQRAHELMAGPLRAAQLEDLFASFLQVGRALHIPQLPETYEQWLQDRERHIERDLAYSDFTRRLFEQYRRQLGPWRYQLLLEIQALLVPQRVRELLKLRPKPLLIGSCLQAYSVAGRFGLQALAQRVLIPEAYWSEIDKLKPAIQDGHCAGRPPNLT